MTLRIITSAAYVDEELQAEFGALPPVMLPLGGGVLAHQQLQRFAPDGGAIITLPDDFDLQPQRSADLSARGASFLKLRPGLSLGASVAEALSLLEVDGPIEIMHGDTLLSPPANPANGADIGDCYSVADIADGYHWARVLETDGRIASVRNNDDASLPGLSGWFRISDSIAFLRALTRNGHRFIDALADYAQRTPVRALRIDDWLDFGHVQTYFRSRHVLLSARHFNSLKLESGCVVKTSRDRFKMRAESEWLAGLPPRLKLYAAQLIDPVADLQTDAGKVDAARYSTEYHHYPTLAEIASSRLGRTGWRHIADALDDFLCDARGNEEADEDIYRILTSGKLRDRIAASPDAYPDLDRVITVNGRVCPTGREIADRLDRIIARSSAMPCEAMHGDFCFSNILYDSRAQRIKLIDPRGFAEAGKTRLSGDTRYDLAKLSHSVVGGYDQIIADNFAYARDGDQVTLAVGTPHLPIGDVFADRSFAERSLFDSDVMAGMVGLFLSMIPLHADRPHRQRAFYANALDLYMTYLEDTP